MLNIYRSRESVDKEKFIYQKIKSEAEVNGPTAFGVRNIVIVPDQYTLAAERQAMNRLQSDVLLDVEVTGISRLGGRLLEEVGIPPTKDGKKPIVINRYGRHMLISRILRELDDSLVAFKGFSNRETFIEAINDFISAAKQHELTPTSLMDLKGGDSAAFSHKLNDLALIFSEYQKKLRGKYTDNEDLIDIYIDAVSKSKTIAKSKIWVYGFDSYTPKNARFIMALAQRAKEVNLHLIFDENCRDEDLFSLSGNMTEAFRRSATELGVPINVYDIHEPKAAKTPALEFMEKELFAVGKRRFTDADSRRKKGEIADGTKGEIVDAQENPIDDRINNAIKIVSCSNVYAEAEAAAGYVLKLLREENYRFSDIVMICNDQELRAPIIRRVFNEYGMDIFDDKKRDALNSPVSIYVLSILEIIAFGFRTPDVIRFLKTGLTSIPREEIDELENYVTKYKIKGSMWLKPFDRGAHERRYNPDEGGKLQEIEAIRLKLLELIEPVEKLFDTSKTYHEFAEGYVEVLGFNQATDQRAGSEIDQTDEQTAQGISPTDAGLLERIEDLVKVQEEAGLLEETEVTRQMPEVIIGLFDQIGEIMEDDEFDGENFARLIRSGLSQMEIGVLPPTADDIMLGTMQRTRSGDCKAMLVIGANDDLIPRTAGENVLFSREELEFLEQKNQHLGMDGALRLMEENLAIYRNLAKPSEHLWISYSVKDQKSDDLRPADIIKSIHQIFPDIEEELDPVSSGEVRDYIGGHINTLRHYADHQRTKEINDDVWSAIEGWLEEADDEILERVRTALRFDNVKDPLPQELASGLYAKYVNRDGDLVYRFSPTSLERYSRCPFSFFMTYGLRSDELRVDEVGPRDIGELYHNTLQRFTEHVDKWSEINREESDALIEKLAGEWKDEYRSKLFGKDGNERYRFDRAVKACKYIAWTLVEQARAGLIEESHFETPFAIDMRGSQKTSDESSPDVFILKPIVKNVPGGKAYIEGKIDRIDFLQGDSVKIIDYKTGKESLAVNDVESGYRLQLMLYMQAAQEHERKPAGVFYFLISEPELDISDAKSNVDVDEKIKESYRMDGLMVDDEGVIRAIAGDIYDADGKPLESSSSKVVKLKRKKDGDLDAYSKKRLMSDAQFGELQNTVDMLATKICNDIVQGRIDLSPVKKSEYTQCKYCNFKSVCRFDTVFPGCRYRII